MVTREQKIDLANMVIRNIQKDFEYIHLTKNLITTITIEETDKGGIRVVIPAPRYDIDRLLNDGEIVYTGEGSYAQEVNETGGFSKKHKDYLDRCVDAALAEWIHKYNIKGRVS